MRKSIGRRIPVFTAVLAALLICVSSTSAVSAQTVASNDSSEKTASELGLASQNRQQIIADLISEYIRSGESLDDPDVKSAIYNDISKKMTLEPKAPLKKSSYEEISSQAAAIVEKQYNTSIDEVKSEAQAEAERKYEMAPLHEKILVKYRKGPYAYRYRGTLYARNAKNVLVDDIYISYIDMIPETRVKLDKRFNEKAKEDFIQERVREFTRETALQALEIQDKIREQEQLFNETQGYIMDPMSGAWMSAKEYADILMHPESELRRTVKQNTDLSTRFANLETVAKDPYDAAMRKARERLEEINNTYSGIDGDQGYKFALWGFSRTEVQLVLSKEDEYSTLNRLINADVLTVEDGDRLELHYLNNILFKTIQRKADCTDKEFRSFFNDLYNRYGSVTGDPKSTSELVKERDSCYQDIISGKQTPQSVSDDGNSYSVVWNGLTTTGTLSFTYDPASKEFRNITFSKEYAPLKEE